MVRVASIIPPDSKGSLTLCNGTQVLLDNGEYLQHVNKITLVAEPGQPWKAIIEVHPTNQEQIDAVLTDLEVVKRNYALNRLQEIQEEIKHLEFEKAALEYKCQSKSGVWTDGVKDVPKEGTWVLKEGETIIPLPAANNGVLEKLHERLNGAKTEIPPATEKVKDFYGAIHSFPDLKGEQDES